MTINLYNNAMSLIKIAIADDQNIVRAGVCSFIENSGNYKVLMQAENGKELIDKIQKSKELPDICIIDISMPIMNGYETVKKIRASWPEMKILALTMFDDEYCIIKMLSSGANGYVAKGEHSGNLLYALNSLHKNGFYNSDLISNRLFHAIIKSEKPIPDLKEHEIRFLQYVCTDLTYSDIAQKLNITVRNIESCRDHLFEKFKVKSRSSLVLFAIRLGIVPLH